MADDQTGVDLLTDIQNGSLDAAAPGTSGAVQPQVVQDTGGIQAPPGTLPAHLAEQERKGEDLTLRDQLSSAFKQSPDANAAPETVANEHAPGTLESNRRADGTFKSKEELEADKGKIGMQRLTQQAAAQPGTVQAPAGMAPAEATAFTALPAEMQQYIARTMAGVEEQANSFRELAALQQVITPQRVGAWAMNGMTANQAVSQLLALSDFATADPAGFALQFCAQHGIDIGRLAESYVPPDPAVLALQRQLAETQQQVQHFTQGAQEAQLNSTISVIEQFALAKGADGNLLRPHWDELTASNSIMPFIQSERAANPNASAADILNAAYDRACWGNPAIRAKMQSATEASRLADQRKVSEAARAASSSVTGAPAATGNANDNTGGRSLREDLTAAFAKYRVAV